MSNTEKIEILSEIRYIINANIEEKLLVCYYALPLYFKSIKVFGLNNFVTKDIINIITEFNYNINYERLFLKRIMTNINDLDYDDVNNLLSKLNLINKQTVFYYYELIDDKEIAIETNNMNKALRRKKTFKLISEMNL